jgi:hypothetical protein
MFLPRETCLTRVGQESAEVVVVMRARESGQERRTEGATVKRPTNLWSAMKQPERQLSEAEDPPNTERT